jgi:hypothetical protein
VAIGAVDEFSAEGEAFPGLTAGDTDGGGFVDQNVRRSHFNGLSANTEKRDREKTEGQSHRRPFYLPPQINSPAGRPCAGLVCRFWNII